MDVIIKKIQSLQDRGYSWKDIGAKLGIAPSTAHRWYHGSVPKQCPHREEKQHNNVRGRKFRYKKDLVRYYLEQHNTAINLDEIYHLATKYFKDWKTENKDDVLRWIKQYINQITTADAESIKASEIPNIKVASNNEFNTRESIITFSVNNGAEIIRSKLPHIYNDVAGITKSYQSGRTNSPVGNLKLLFKKAGWKNEWKISDKIDHRADAYKDRIVVELEFSNRDQCHRDFNRFVLLHKDNKIDAAVLVTFADNNAVARWKKDKSIRKKRSIQILTLDYLRNTVEAYKRVIADVPIWFIGIR